VTVLQLWAPTIFQIVVLLLLVIIATAVFRLTAQWRSLKYRARYQPSYDPHLRDRWPPGLRYPLWEIIERAETDSGVVLTWGAREMLSIPIVELLEMRGDVNWVEVDSSVRDIVRTIGEESQSQQLRPPRTKDSVSVIRGFARRFCNIPPFCSRDEERR